MNVRNVTFKIIKIEKNRSKIKNEKFQYICKAKKVL
jgi:hypothetical protein